MPPLIAQKDSKLAFIRTIKFNPLSAEYIIARRNRHPIANREIVVQVLKGLNRPSGTGSNTVSVQEEIGVQWPFCFLSADKKKTHCLYEAPSADALREAARRLNFPADAITVSLRQ